MKKKLAIVSTHPIQYNAPWFGLLNQSSTVQVKVFYTWSQSQGGAKFDPGFGRVVEWDIPLLEGYDYCFVENTASKPGTSHFGGIVNPGLIPEIESWRADAVLIMGWNFSSHFSCMRYFKGRIPVMFRGDSTLLDEIPGVKRTIRRLFLTFIYRYVDYALYVGENNRLYFKAHGLKDKQLFKVPHAIDNTRFGLNKFEELAQAKRRELGICDDDFLVLFAGKMEPKKDPDFILQLAGILDEPSIKFLLVGNGVLEASLKEKAKGDNRIKFLDFQNQSAMPVMYRMADIFILPSRGPGETWGLAINEAMASGRPVMVSEKVGGAPDLVKDGQNGIIIQPGELNKAAECIRSLASDKNNWKKMAGASSSLIREFTFEKIATNIEKLISKI
ncbi:glycosyltransferase family 4 protein [Flavihumibacter fluvii]|uniref:glycosyltransferase family 4 protein n=1 Tax=Flavihumibacter fluvii TaxID=2838157 RepID=UPI001BDEC8F2|nr:glycosyltransferase family 4 protein [Flavihumibacter fluvii]ULQ52401.1 glycosyltransferase family 4 protein [Flavihumibacter fluvii]